MLARRRKEARILWYYNQLDWFGKLQLVSVIYFLALRRHRQLPRNPEEVFYILLGMCVYYGYIYAKYRKLLSA